jgi:hypothetical protein
MAATATISHRLNCNYALPPNNLLKPLLIGQGKRFQQSPSKTMLLCPCTDSGKVATLLATAKSSLPCNEHLSSVKHCMKRLVRDFGPAPRAGASTQAQCQTVEHAPRNAMRCPEYSA